MEYTIFTKESLGALREQLRGAMSEKRYRHTVAVEEMVTRLAALYCPEKIDVLRAAALLHDITKELDIEEQIRICHEKGIPVEDHAELAPKVFHAKTAAALIPDLYPTYAHPEVISAVRWHTTGHAHMTLSEKLVYLADYIDESRRFPDCVRLRNLFWDAQPQTMTPDKRAEHLRDVLIVSYEMTVRSLLDDGALISADTMLARNELIIDKKSKCNH